MKLTEQQKQAVVKDYLDGVKVAELVDKYGISRSSVYLLLKRHKEQNANKYQQVNANNIRLLNAKGKKLEDIISVLKNIDCSYNAPLQQKLYAMEMLCTQFSIHTLCDAMDVPRSTFYNHLLRNKKKHKSYVQRREVLREKIQQIYDDSKQIFGAQKILAVLQEQGVKTSIKMVRQLMRDMGIESIRQHSKKLYDKEHKRKNIVDQKFTTTAPNQVWVGDITYFRLHETTYYICVILDLYARMVVGYKIGKKNSTQLATSTFKIAYRNRNPESGLIFHSDNGSNYVSYAFESCLRSLSVAHSFSKPYIPYDNSVMESFFATLKKEEMYRTKYKSEKEMFQSVAEYITFYNEKRPHCQNKYKTPLRKEMEYYAQE